MLLGSRPASCPGPALLCRPQLRHKAAHRNVAAAASGEQLHDRLHDMHACWRSCLVTCWHACLSVSCFEPSPHNTYFSLVRFGLGIFCLCIRLRIKKAFCERTLRDKPIITGGPHTCGHHLLSMTAGACRDTCNLRC